MDLFDDYSQRLVTYNSFVMVHYKLSPSKIAQFGWIWDDGILKCVSCQSKYKILEFSEDLDLRKPQYLRCLNELKFSHDKNCPYYDCQRFKISQDFMHINAMAYYKECLNSLKAIDVDLKFIDRIPPEYKIVFYDGNQLSIRKAAAIFGWQNFNDKLLCKYCGRIAENTPQFDIFIEHRYFCNWCNESINKQKSFGFIYLIQQLYEEYVTNGQAQPNEYVKLGAIRRQIGQYVETMIKESNEISAYLSRMSQENQLINQKIKQRNKFDINKFREEQQSFQQEIQKKIKLNEELIQSEQKLHEQQEQQNNQNQESEFKNLLEQQIQQEKMIIEDERVSFRFDEYVQPPQESQKNFDQISLSQIEQRLNDLQSFKNVEQDVELNEQIINQNQQIQQNQIQQEQPIGGKILPQDFVIMTNSLFTNEQEVRKHEQEVQQQQQQEDLENARKQFEVEIPVDNIKFVSLNQMNEIQNDQIVNNQPKFQPIIELTTSHLIKQPAAPNIIKADSVSETGEDNQIIENNQVQNEKLQENQQQIQNANQDQEEVQKENEHQMPDQIEQQNDQQKSQVQATQQTAVNQQINIEQENQIQQVVKDLSIEYQQEQEEQQQRQEENQQLSSDFNQDLDDEKRIQQQIDQEYLDQINQVDQQEYQVQKNNENDMLDQQDEVDQQEQQNQQDQQDGQQIFQQDVQEEQEQQENEILQQDQELDQLIEQEYIPQAEQINVEVEQQQALQDQQQDQQFDQQQDQLQELQQDLQQEQQQQEEKDLKEQDKQEQQDVVDQNNQQIDQ